MVIRNKVQPTTEGDMITKMPSGFDDAELQNTENNPPENVVPQTASLRNYPKGVFFCLGNEFAERFSFYGMRAILTIYLISIHDMEEHSAKLVYHAFITIAYFTPILGSIIADGFFGRYRVILYISILYVIGHVLLTVGAAPNLGSDALKALDFVGLLVIAIATGGIKPCVSSFAADQFPPERVAERKQFFSFFYFSINLGALLSKIVTPILRGRVQCLGQDTCYPLAFGVPAIFMLVALIIFVCGKPFYHIVKCEENIIWKITKCICYALGKFVKAPKRNCLDYAIPKYGTVLVGEIRAVMSVCILFLPVIPFWGLFDQIGSTWVIQASQMDGRLGQLTVLPEQMSVLNPVLVILLVPVLESMIYPFLAKWQILIKPLRRMGWGGFLAAVSFVIAGLLQLAVNKTSVHLPEQGTVRYVLANRGHCPLLASSQNSSDVSVQPNANLIHNFHRDSYVHFSNCSTEQQKTQQENVLLNFTQRNKGHLYVFWEPDVDHVQSEYDLHKTASGKSRIYFVIHPKLLKNNNVTIHAYQDGLMKFTEHKSKKYIEIQPSLISQIQYQIVMKICDDVTQCTNVEIFNYNAQMGGAHAFIIGENHKLVKEQGNFSVEIIELISPNTISLMWQVPQYFVITVGELLLSISGLEFSYSQAPASMKSFLQAIWLLTVAFGNILDMIISGSHMIDDRAGEFFVYAILMALVMLVFVFLAYRYNPLVKEQTAADNEQHGKIMSTRPVVKSNSLDFVKSRIEETEN